MRISARQDIITSGERHVYIPAKTAGTKRLVVFLHGVGQSALDATWYAHRAMRLFKAINDADLPQLIIDGDDESGWGNDASVTRLAAAWTWAKANLPVKTDKLCLVGSSMGATWGLNYAKANPTQVAGFAGIIPCLDLQYIVDNNPSSLAAGVTTAYGTINDAVYAAHSPVRFGSSVTAVPQKLWYSDTDTVTPNASTNTYATASGAALASLGSIGHSLGSAPLGSVPNSDIAAWLLSKA